jgi:hypothetical protein
VPPFEHGIQGPAEIGGRTVEPFYWLSFTFPFNLTGQPAATVPAGWTADGLPVGLQIAGRRLDDPTVLHQRSGGAPRQRGLQSRRMLYLPHFMTAEMKLPASASGVPQLFIQDTDVPSRSRR